MRTNIVLDDDQVREAFRYSHAKIKKDLIHEALHELIRARSRKSLLDLRGKIRRFLQAGRPPVRKALAMMACASSWIRRR